VTISATEPGQAPGFLFAGPQSTQSRQLNSTSAGGFLFGDFEMPDGSGGGVFHALLEWLQPYLTYAWFVFLALWGGTANYVNQLRAKKVPFSFVAWVFELVISGFAGLCTAYLCESLNMPFPAIAVAAGVAGYQGGAAINKLKGYWPPKGTNL